MKADGSEPDVTQVLPTADAKPTETPHGGTHGPILAGEHYRIGHQLGRGGMGEVVAAYDTLIGREVAIKRLHDERPPVEVQARFLREAQVQGRLDHPSIPPVYELGHDAEGRPYIVMKRLSGTTLAQIIADVEAGTTPYPRERLLRAFVDVCLAVELAHTRGVVHRDLKPANIMLGEFGEVYVLDWGVAKVLGDTAREPLPAPSRKQIDPEHTTDGTVIGTPAYMSPEQREGRLDVDGRADVFSLGRILCEILAAKKLRRAMTSDDERRPSFHASDREIPPELDELCFDATAVQPERRIDSARALADRVQRYLDGDRDLVERRKLAANHLQRALSFYESEQTHAAAIREAGRALALDPRLEGAAELVSRLMLETPKTMPLEVERSLADVDTSAIVRSSRMGSFAYFAYIAWVPPLLMIGVRSMAYVVALIVTALVLAATALFGLYWPHARWRVPVMILANGVMIAVVARMFTPFMVAPGVAGITAMVLFRSPAFRGRWLVPTVLALLAGVIGPWAVEELGWLPTTHAFINGGVLLNSPTIDMPPLGMGIGLMFYVTTIVAVAAATSVVHARAQRTALQQLHLQAWRLRQLVPQPV